MSELNGKVAIVTGASAGIGRAAALALAAEGAAVVVADVDDARGEDIAAEINDKGGRARFVHADVSDDAQVEAMVRQTVEEFGGLDLAFNNAGIEGAPAPTHECTPENWQRMLAVNLTGVWSCMRHEIPRMLERGVGRSSTARRWPDWSASPPSRLTQRPSMASSGSPRPRRSNTPRRASESTPVARA